MPPPGPVSPTWQVKLEPSHVVPPKVKVAVVDVKPEAEKVMVYVVPTVPESTPRLLNVATPEDAVAVVVPRRVAPELMDAVTTSEEDMTVLLLAS